MVNKKLPAPSFPRKAGDSVDFESPALRGNDEMAKY